MKTDTDVTLKVADHVWVATALLHKENPGRSDFSKQEIRQRAEQEDAEGSKRPGISQHISTHCVASKPPMPAKHRMLTRTQKGRRRLYRDEDPTHPGRHNGNTTPNREDLHEKYHSLLDWYEREYNHKQNTSPSGTKQGGATAETMMKLIGRISREDADEMIRIIDECCGRVDANEW